MNEWDNIDLGSSQDNVTSWDEIDLDTNKVIQDIMDRGIDKKKYTKDDELWKMGETKDGNPIYKTKDDMGPLDSLRASFAQTPFSEGINKLFGLTGNEADVKVVDGKREQMDNKIINDMDNQQLQEYMGANMVQSDNPEDRHFYMFEYKEPDGSTSYKYGTADKSFQERYKNQPEILNNATLLFDSPVANADELEHNIHGSKWARDNRRFDFGNAKMRGSGASEYYKADTFLFGEKTTGTKQTETQQKATSEVENILDDSQKQILEDVRGKAYNPNNVKLSRTDLFTEKTDNMSNKELIEQMRIIDENQGAFGQMSTTGAMPEDILATKPQYQKIAGDLGRRLFGNIVKKDATPQEQATQLNEAMSEVNWNIATLVARGLDISKMEPKMAEQMADAIEMYNMTDTSAQQIKRGLGAVATDPTTYATLGIANVPKTLSKRAASKMIVETLRKRASGESLNPSLGKQVLAKATSNEAKLAGTEGALYAGVDNGVKQTFKVRGRDEEFNSKEFLTAIGAGTVLGGTLGSLLSHQKPGSLPDFNDKQLGQEIANINKKIRDGKLSEKQLEKAKESRKFIRQWKQELKKYESDKAKREEVLARGIEHMIEQDFLRMDMKARIEGREDTVVTENVSEEDIANIDTQIQSKEEELSKQEDNKDIVPTSQKIKPTKFSQEEKNAPTTELVNPVTSRGKEIDIGEVPQRATRQKKVIGKEDTAGRWYQKDGYLQSHQGGLSGFAQTKKVDDKIDKTNTESVLGYIDQQSKNFIEKRNMEKVYGQNAAKETKKRKRLEVNENEEIAARLDHKIEEVKKMLKDKDVSKEVKKDLQEILSGMKEQRQGVRNYGVMTPAMEKEIASKYDEQFKPSFDYDNSKRNTEAYDRYLAIRDTKDWKTRIEHSPYGKASQSEKIKIIGNIFKSWADEADRLKVEVGKAEERLREQLLSKGIHDDLSVLPEKGVNMDDVRLVQRYRDLNDDMYRLANNKMSPDEAIFTHTEKLDEGIQAKIEDLIKDGSTIEEATSIVAKEYEDSGVNVKAEAKRLEPENKEKKNISSEQKKKVEDKKKDKDTDFKKNNEEVYQKQLEKFKGYIEKGNQSKRRTAINRPRRGQEVVTPKQQKLLDAGVPPEEVARLNNPENATIDTFEHLKKEQQIKVNKIFNDIRRKKLGIDTNTRFMERPHSLSVSETMIDASNSMLQMMSVLTGNDKMAMYSKLDGGSNDVRMALGEEMSKVMELPNVIGQDGKKKTWKDLVKPLFMTENYGQGEKGLITNLMKDNGFDYEMAKKFHDEYQNAMKKIFPEIGKFRNLINERMKKPELGPDISWTLPDGKKVTLSIKKEVDNTWSMRNIDGVVTEKIEDLDVFSSSLMPQYIQSYDAYVARQMRKKGYLTNHDAFVITKGKTEIDAQNDYGEILSKILESDSFEKNLSEMGMPKKISKGTLSKEKIMNAQHKMEVEHMPSKPEFAEERKFTNDNMKSDKELMREYMASSNFRKIETHSLIDAIVDDIGRDVSYAKAHEKDDVFERQASLALQSPVFNNSLSIKAPEGLDEKVWNKVQREIFYESRAKLERNPNASDIIKGQRQFFDGRGRPLNSNILNRKEIEQTLRKEDFRNRVEMNKAVRLEIQKSNTEIQRIKKEIVELENKKGELMISLMSPKQKRYIIDIGKDYKSLAKSVDSWETKRILSEEERFAQLVVGEARKSEKDISKIPELEDRALTRQWLMYFSHQVNFTDESLKQFVKLQNLDKKYSGNVARYAEEIKKDLRSKIPESEREAWTKNIIHTDYKAIDGTSREDAQKFMKDYDNIYKIAKKYIDKAADGLSAAERQVGMYYNNAIGIVEKLDLPEASIPVVDKMISIKAMTDDAWKFVEKNKDTDIFKQVMSQMKTNHTISRDILFKNNPKSMIKGYYRDVYNQNLTIDKNGKLIFNTEAKYERGVLPMDREKATRGRSERDGANIPDDFKPQKETPIKDEFPDFVNMVMYRFEELKKEGLVKGQTLKSIANEIAKRELITDEFKNKIPALLREGMSKHKKKVLDESDFDLAQKLGIKITGKEPRKIAGEQIRESLGRSKDFTEILSTTISETQMKVGKRKQSQEIMKGEFSKIISNEEKEGFVKIPDSKIAMLPKELQSEIAYVKKDMYDAILGRNEATIYTGENKYARILDKLVRDMTTRFKKNNVLSNTTSHVNALMFNQMIAPSIGIKPNDQVKWQQQAIEDMIEMSHLWEKIALRKSQGKPISQLMKKLQDNRLYQLEQAGLATNTIDGIDMKPDLWREMTGMIFGQSETVNRLTRNIFAEGDSLIGQMFEKSFTGIDTSGRYMAAMQYMKNGMNIEDAVRKANGLFGDMNQIAPTIIDIVDKYPIIPFMKWFSRVAPMLAVATKENPIKMIGVSMALYGISRYFEDDKKQGMSSFRTDGWNPGTQILDFSEGSTIGAFDDMVHSWNRDVSIEQKIIERMDKYFAPAFLTKPLNNAIKKDVGFFDYDWSKFIASDRPKNFENIKGAPLELKGKTQEFLDTWL